MARWGKVNDATMSGFMIALAIVGVFAIASMPLTASSATLVALLVVAIVAVLLGVVTMTQRVSRRSLSWVVLVTPLSLAGAGQLGASGFRAPLLTVTCLLLLSCGVRQRVWFGSRSQR